MNFTNICPHRGGCLYFQLNKEYYVVQIFLHDQPDEELGNNNNNKNNFFSIS